MYIEARLSFRMAGRAVVDWEYQGVLHPAILAASYPPWLSYDGCSNPRFVNPKLTFWLDKLSKGKQTLARFII